MWIIGCDLHTRYQQITLLGREAGDDERRRLCGEVATRRLEQENGEAKTYSASLPKASLIRIEATATRRGSSAWWPSKVASWGWGDPAEIRACAVRRQKTDTRDAESMGTGTKHGAEDRAPRPQADGVWLKSA